MTLVVDASAVVAALVDSGADGRWAEVIMVQDILAAPHLLPVEATNILRRAVLTEKLSADAAALAHEDLLQLRIDLFPYEPYAGRVWQLRNNLTPYDAWYAALAESVEAPLVTLDRRMARAQGLTCSFRLPPEQSVPETFPM
jgi:predicted nucleic acid-binding protein